MTWNLWRRVLHAWAGRLRVKVVATDVGDATGATGVWRGLFERYLVVGVRRGATGAGGAGAGGAGVFLHHYLRSDPDRGLHNHPWNWAIAVPLAGGYWEQRADVWNSSGIATVLHRRRPFVPYIIRARDWHRLILIADYTAEDTPGGGAPETTPETTSWSLFIHGPYTRGWGFVRRTPGADGVQGQQSQPYRYYAAGSAGEVERWQDRPRGREIPGRAEP